MKDFFSQWDSSIKLVAVLGALAVVMGAFGAHFLKERLNEIQLISYKTGVSYHFYHTLAMLALITLSDRIETKILSLSLFFFTIGILFFSGSLYLLACREVIGLGFYKWLGPITPIGGIFFILGWLNLGRIKR